MKKTYRWLFFLWKAIDIGNIGSGLGALSTKAFMILIFALFIPYSTQHNFMIFLSENEKRGLAPLKNQRNQPSNAYFGRSDPSCVFCIHENRAMASHPHPTRKGDTPEWLQ